MYTVIKSSGVKVIFAGTYADGYVNDLFIKQLGFNCRKESMVKVCGSILKGIFSGKYQTMSTKDIISFIISNKKESHSHRDYSIFQSI